jgi:hypothetical protein
MRQDIIDAAAFSVWARVQAGEPLSMTLCHRVIGVKSRDVVYDVVV